MSDLDAIRERHRSVAFPVTAWCIEDVQEWPCDAVRLLEANAALEDIVEKMTENIGREYERAEKAERIIEAADQLADTAEVVRHGPYVPTDEDMDAMYAALERYRKERG